MPDPRIAWSGHADVVAVDPGVLVVPALAGVSDDAVLVWGDMVADGATGSSYSRFTSGGVDHDGVLIDRIDIAPGFAIIGVGGWWYLPGAGALLRAGGQIAVNWGNIADPTPTGVIAACVVDLGGPTEIDVGDSYQYPGEPDYPGYLNPVLHGYAREITVDLYEGIYGSYIFENVAFEEIENHQHGNATIQLWDRPDGARDVAPPDDLFPPVSGATWWYSVQGALRFRLAPVPGPDADVTCFRPEDWTPSGGASLSGGGRSASLPLHDGAGTARIESAFLNWYGRPYNDPNRVPPLPGIAVGLAPSFLVLRWPAWDGTVIHMTLTSDAGPDMGSGGSLDVAIDGTTVVVTETTQWGATIARGSMPFDPTLRFWQFVRANVTGVGFKWGVGAAPGDGDSLTADVTWLSHVAGLATDDEPADWAGRAQVAFLATNPGAGDHGAWVLGRFKDGCPFGRVFGEILG